MGYGGLPYLTYTNIIAKLTTNLDAQEDSQSTQAGRQSQSPKNNDSNNDNNNKKVDKLTAHCTRKMGRSVAVLLRGQRLPTNSGRQPTARSL
jgi:sorbitol-specific phosphotransferase system component IIBC